MDRIDNVDLREALRQIAENNTFFHRENDLGISFGQMERAAKMDDPTEKTLIWVSTPGGIDCYTEREVFQHNTRAHNGVLFHGFDMQSDRKLAYAVVVSGVVQDELRGSITEIDIRRYAEHVKQNVLSNDTVRLFLGDFRDNEKQMTMPRHEFDQRYPVFGNHSDEFHITYSRHEPDDHSRLYALLDSAAKDREAASTPRADLWSHTTRLYDERYDFYAAQTVREISKLQSPNSPDKKDFTVRLNAYIATAFGNNELGKLLDALPYKTAAITVQKGQPDMRVIIPRDEVLQHRRGQEQQDAQPQKTSILGQLADAQKEAAARQSANTPKKHKETEL